MSLTDVANQFLNVYFETFSKSRADIGSFYGDASQVNWDGKDLTGRAAIEAHFQTALKINDLKYQSLEHVAQLVPGDLILITVTGFMNVDGGPPLQFTRVFVLQQAAGSWFIRNEVFKFGFAA